MFHRGPVNQTFPPGERSVPLGAIRQPARRVLGGPRRLTPRWEMIKDAPQQTRLNPPDPLGFQRRTVYCLRHKVLVRPEVLSTL